MKANTWDNFEFDFTKLYKFEEIRFRTGVYALAFGEASKVRFLCLNGIVIQSANGIMKVVNEPWDGDDSVRYVRNKGQIYLIQHIE